MFPSRRLNSGRRLAAVALLALAIPGCGGEGASSSLSTGRTAAASKPAAPQDPRLSRPGSPGAAVFTTLRYLQLGALPSAMAQYEPVAVRTVRVKDFAGAAQVLSRLLQGAQPRLRSVTPTRSGADATVVVRFPRKGARTGLGTFNLHRTRGEWLIAYDTAMENAIRFYATRRTRDGAVGRRAAAAFRTVGHRAR